MASGVCFSSRAKSLACPDGSTRGWGGCLPFSSWVPSRRLEPRRALFVCTRNSARSQLAAAIWKQMTQTAALSAGTHPAEQVYPGAIAAAKRAGLSLEGAAPHALDKVATLPRLVVTVCDQAHEELDANDTWLHWSIQDPVVVGTKAAFDSTVAELRARIIVLVGETGVAL